MTTLYSVSSYLTAMNVPALLSATIIHIQTCLTEFLAALFLLMQLCAVCLGITRSPILSKPRFNVFFWLPQMLRRPATKENKYQWWNVVLRTGFTAVGLRTLQRECSPTCVPPRKSGDLGPGTLDAIFWGPRNGVRSLIAFLPTLTTDRQRCKAKDGDIWRKTEKDGVRQRKTSANDDGCDTILS